MVVDLKQERIELVKAAPVAKGKAEYLKWLEGGKLSRKEAMDANCYLCMGYYSDGRGECSVKLCPVRNYMPYNPNRIKRTSNLSDEQKKGVRDRLQKARSLA